MASEEAKIRVRLDTRQAKGELRSLTREGSRTAGRVGRGLRSIVGRGFAAVGLAGGVAAAQAAIRGPTQSGLAAIASQTLGGIGARLMNDITGGYGPEAIGRARALEQTIGAYGFLAGHQKAIPEEAAAFNEHIARTLTIPQERGRNLFLQDKRFRNEWAGKLDEIYDLAKEFFSPKSWVEKYNPFRWLYNQAEAGIRRREEARRKGR